MENSCRLRITTLILALVPSIAVADPGWYLAVDAGRTAFSNDAKPDAVLATASGAGQPSSPLTHEDDGTGHRLALGYGFSPYWGIEFGYVDLGEATSDVNIVTNPSPSSCGLSCADSYDLATKLTARAWTIHVIGNLPLGDSWALYGRAGYFIWRLDLNDNITPTNSPPYGNKSIPTTTSAFGYTPLFASLNATGWHSTYGVGVRWSVAAHWTACLGWDTYQGMSFNTPFAYSVDVNIRSLGIEYQF